MVIVRLGRWLADADARSDWVEVEPVWWRALMLVGFGYAVFVVTWVPINAFSVGREAATLYLPGESAIPLIVSFEYLYALGYALPVIAVLKTRTAGRLVRLMVAFGMILTVAYTTYLLFPVYLERPELVVDSFASYLLSVEYRDPSYNHFPSLHVALVWLGFFACRSGLRRPWIYAVTAFGMTVATLFVKQHYLVDLVYGFVLAVAAWRLTRGWVRSAVSRVSVRETTR
jgi:membrane-associated phospholipid phosphatase